MPTLALPSARSSLTDSRTGAVSVEWYTFFSNMLKAAVDSGLLDAGAMASILERLTALEDADGGVVVGPVSVQVLGTLAGGGVTVRLRNDSVDPGNTYYYGTGPTGTKGWFTVASALAADAGELEKTVGADGVTSFGLADLADSGAGTFKLITRDAKGRVSGTLSGDTDDVPEGATNLYFTDARARAAVEVPPGYIDGLTLQWVSAAALTVSSGSAYIEGSGKIVPSTAAIAKAGLALSASTWYHVYLYLNAGTPDVEIVTTAPVAYNGTARSKTGDTTRRYLGSVLTDGAGNLYNFLHVANRMQWRIDPGAAPFRVLSGGVATVVTSVSLAGVVPVTSRLAQLRLINLATNAAILRVGTSDDSSAAGIAAINQSPAGSTVSQAFLDFPINASQAVEYNFTAAPAGSGAFIDVYGYTYER